MRRNNLFILILLLAVSLTACGDLGEGEETVGPGKETYSVGIDTAFPPFVIEKDDGYTGIDVSIIEAIAENQNFEIEFKPTDFSSMFPALQNGSLDIGISGISITKERKEMVHFSEPYYTAGLALVTTEETLGVKDLTDMKNKTLVVKKGTTGAKYAIKNKDQYNYHIIQVTDTQAMYDEVINGEGVALLADAPTVSYAINQQELPLEFVRKKLKEYKYAIAVSKDLGGGLIEKINNGLKNLKESGKLEEIINEYTITR